MLHVTDARPVPLCLEAVPPLLEQGQAGLEAVLEKVRALHEAVGLDGVNIPEIHEESSKSAKGERLKPFKPRMEPRQLAWEIQEGLGIPCMINRVVVYLNPARQSDWLRETWEVYGVRHFVLVGGEHSSREYPGPTVPEANELAREVLGDDALRIGNICIPTRAGEAARMQRKMRTGVDFFTTQIVYHGEEVTALLDGLAREAEPAARPPQILLSLCPVRSRRNIRFLHWLGVSLSAELEEALTGGPESVAERSLAHIADMWEGIHAHHRATRSPFPVAVSLAPIGRIPNEMTARLGRAIVESD